MTNENTELSNAIEWWQTCGKFHPLTCPIVHEPEEDRILKAGEDESGTYLYCGRCGYKQSYVPPIIGDAFQRHKEKP